MIVIVHNITSTVRISVIASHDVTRTAINTATTLFRAAMRLFFNSSAGAAFPRYFHNPSTPSKLSPDRAPTLPQRCAVCGGAAASLTIRVMSEVLFHRSDSEVLVHPTGGALYEFSALVTLGAADILLVILATGSLGACTLEEQIKQTTSSGPPGVLLDCQI